MATRRYFLDWLRVLAFALLIVFHTGMLYVTWNYNIKSPRLMPDLEWAMLALSPWRMVLIFLISGVASRFLLDKFGPGAFALDRLRRLLPVVLFGMFVVIPPQTWIMLVDRGITHQAYLDFWWNSYLKADQTMVRPLHRTMPTWDHLWYLVYLLAYTLVFALVSKLTGLGRGRPNTLPLGFLTIAPALWLVGSTMVVEHLAPRTDGFVNDWGSHLKWAGMFATGVTVAMRGDFWVWAREHRAALVRLAGALLLLMLADHAFWLTGRLRPPADWISWSTTSGLYAWSMVLAVCGYAARYLDRPSALLSYLNEAILPVYVLHQPILLLTAYAVFPLRLPLAEEALLLIGATAVGALVLYQLLIRPFAVMRFLFGLKRKRRAEDNLAPLRPKRGEIV